jgi:hypothetical protein
MLLSLFTAAILVSCSNGPTLQTYFVDHQEAPNFISQDLPISMLNMDTSAFTEEEHEAFKSVSRLNFLGFKTNDKNAEEAKTELATLKEILNKEKYKELIEFSHKGNKFSVKYIGTDEDADEFIILGDSKETGFGVVRVLGNDMNASKMMILAKSLQKADIDTDELHSRITSFFE